MISRLPFSRAANRAFIQLRKEMLANPFESSGLIDPTGRILYHPKNSCQSPFCTTLTTRELWQSRSQGKSREQKEAMMKGFHRQTASNLLIHKHLIDTPPGHGDFHALASQHQPQMAIHTPNRVYALKGDKPIDLPEEFDQQMDQLNTILESIQQNIWGMATYYRLHGLMPMEPRIMPPPTADDIRLLKTFQNHPHTKAYIRYARKRTAELVRRYLPELTYVDLPAPPVKKAAPRQP